MRKVLSVRLPEEEIAQLRAAAEAAGLSISDIVRQRLAAPTYTLTTGYSQPVTTIAPTTTWTYAGNTGINWINYGEAK